MTTGNSTPKKTPAPKRSKPGSADADAVQPLSVSGEQAEALEAMMAKAFSVRTSMEPAADGPAAAPLPPVETQRCGLIAIVGSRSA